MSRASSKARIDRIESYLGVGGNDELPVNTVRDSIQLLSDQLSEMNGMLRGLVEKVAILTPTVGGEDRVMLEELRSEIKVLKMAIGSSSGSNQNVDRTKIPEPKSFDGSRDSKVLENFIWDVEHYFKVTNKRDSAKVDIAALYLSGDAKLWWRSRQVSDGDTAVTTWDGMKTELHRQFLPSNGSWIARGKLRELKHVGTVRDYVTEFMSLMLTIAGMSEEDKLHSFVSGLKPWAQIELRRQNVQDLNAAIVAAEALVDLPLENNVSKWNKDKKIDAEKRKFPNTRGETSDENGGSQKSKKWERGCYICTGPHLARDCPKRQRLAAIVGEGGSDGSSEEEDLSPSIGALKLMDAGGKVKG